MAERDFIYFVSDVHLGLATKDPKEREDRFVAWLKSVPRDTTKAVYLLGDIWDFWYEYRDVVPREGTRVVAQFIDLMDAGVELYFFEGNHDMWTFSFFESLGMKKLYQPCFVQIGGMNFCLGHGDCLGKTDFGYRMMLKIFHSKVARTLFSTLHPWLAFRFGLNWSNSSRRTHKPYHFKGEEEPLFQYAVTVAESHKVDCFVFGHFHDSADLFLPGGQRFFIVKDWMDGACPNLRFSVSSGLFEQSFSVCQ